MNESSLIIPTKAENMNFPRACSSKLPINFVLGITEGGEGC